MDGRTPASRGDKVATPGSERRIRNREMETASDVQDSPKSCYRDKGRKPFKRLAAKSTEGLKCT